jgi:hypothetical protein
VADKSRQLVLDALGRAAAAPAGLPLHGSRSAPGLFPTTAAGKQAAQHCTAEGYLAAARPAAVPAPAPCPARGAPPAEVAPPSWAEPPSGSPPRKRGKPAPQRYTLTEKGRNHLLSHLSPRAVLEDFVRALEARQAQAEETLAAVRQAQADLAALRSSAEQVLERVAGPAAAPNYTWPAEPDGGPPAAADAEAALDAALLGALGRWDASVGSEDCPLPELFRRARAAAPDVTLGRFHDALRRLHGSGRLYLHPWTGPLYELPEPPYALLVGHLVAYYASVRSSC